MMHIRRSQGSFSTTEPRSAYIHVPFCAHRCGYCDFTLVARRDDLIDDYLRALQLQFSDLQQTRKVETLFLGGGTPTHPPRAQLEQLLKLVRKWFVLTGNGEFSIEANPIDLCDDKIKLLADYGVNRVSLGVQSFDGPTLQFLERDHSAEQVLRVVDRLGNRFENVSFDFIFAVPGQSLATWENTLQQGIALAPKHLSTYGLTFEKGTAFWSRLHKRALRQVPDEMQRRMYSSAMDQLTAAGFEHYEISNFARPGFRCRHNQVYWTRKPYWGFGPGAARFLQGRREINHRSVTTWMKRVFSGQSPVGEVEELSEEAGAREAAVLGLRLCDGIERADFRIRTGFELDELAADAIQRHCASDLLEDSGTHLRLTRAGRFLADTVVADFL